jgi:hypothetical protein
MEMTYYSCSLLIFYDYNVYYTTFYSQNFNPKHGKEGAPKAEGENNAAA